MVCGEVGLGGEIRAISAADVRIREAAKLGMKRCVLPEGTLGSIDNVSSVALVGARHLEDLRYALFR